jgi:hypothetical protein
MRRDVDVEDFPPGCRVMTPTGRAGTVIKHRGAESKLDHFLRVTVQLDGGTRHNLVTLQPHLLTKCPPDKEPAPKIEAL